MTKRLVTYILLCLCLLCEAAFAQNGKRFTLVIDPGHGGKDTGAPGAYSVEKNINLKVALAFGQLVERNCPDVKFIQMLSMVIVRLMVAKRIRSVWRVLKPILKWQSVKTV